MLLILIKLKEAYPDVIESFMKDEVSILQSPVLLPKERELLLRLLISYLPPSAVLSVIQNSSPSSSASIIYSLCHLPVDVLLEEYLSVESGLLNTDDSLVVDSIVDLLIAIARHASHFQRIQLIQILFKRMRKSKKNTAAFLQASVGYGGSCFQKDVLDLVYLAETYGLPEVAEYWKWVVRMNDYQKESFARRVIHDMFDTVAGKHLAMFGYAFKKDTGDTRETAAAYVSKILLEEQAHIVAYDPKTTETSMYMELEYTCGVSEATCPQLKKDMVMVKDPYEAAKGAHAILVMTEWDMFKDLDYERIYADMQKPAFLFDGRNILDHAKLRKIGFQVYAIGKPVN